MTEGITGFGGNVLNTLRRKMDRTHNTPMVTEGSALRDLNINPARALFLTKYILENQKLLLIDDFQNLWSQMSAGRITLKNKSVIKLENGSKSELDETLLSGTANQLIKKRFDSLPAQMRSEFDILSNRGLSRNNVVQAWSTTSIENENDPSQSLLVRVNTNNMGQIYCLELASSADAEKRIKLWVTPKSDVVGAHSPSKPSDMLAVADFPGYKKLVFAVNRDEMNKFHNPIAPEHQ